MKKITTLLAFALVAQLAFGQSKFPMGSSWGITTGLTIGIQKWNNSDRDPLFTHHYSIMWENHSGRRSDFYFEAGYHPRGSAIVSRAFVGVNGINYPRRRYATTFHNVMLLLGVKSRYKTSENTRAYYLLGLRGEVTAGFDMGAWQEYMKDFVKRVNFGPSAGGGFEWDLGKKKKYTMFLEFRIDPDLTNQINVPPTGFYDPYSGQNIQVPEQRVRNLSFEVTVGCKLNNYLEEDEEVEE